MRTSVCANLPRSVGYNESEGNDVRHPCIIQVLGLLLDMDHKEMSKKASLLYLMGEIKLVSCFHSPK